MKKLAIITLAIAAISTTACSAVAGEHNKNERRSGAYTQKNHGERMSRDGLPRGFDKLDLSAAQKTQIQAIMQQDRPQANENRRAEMWQQLENRRVEEQKMLQNPAFDEAATRQMLNERMTTQQQKMVEFELKRLKNRHAAFQVLTPAQQTQFLEQQAQRRKK